MSEEDLNTPQTEEDGVFESIADLIEVSELKVVSTEATSEPGELVVTLGCTERSEIFNYTVGYPLPTMEELESEDIVDGTLELYEDELLEAFLYSLIEEIYSVNRLLDIIGEATPHELASQELIDNAKMQLSARRMVLDMTLRKLDLLVGDKLSPGSMSSRMRELALDGFKFDEDFNDISKEEAEGEFAHLYGEIRRQIDRFLEDFSLYALSIRRRDDELTEVVVKINDQQESFLIKTRMMRIYMTETMAEYTEKLAASDLIFNMSYEMLGWLSRGEECGPLTDNLTKVKKYFDDEALGFLNHIAFLCMELTKLDRIISKEEV